MFFKQCFQRVSLVLLAYLQLSSCVFLPPSLTGPLPVGVTIYELNNTSIEPTRDLMVSIFYPASPSCSSFPLALAFNPQTDYYTDNWIANLTNGSSATVSMLAHLNAPISPHHGNVPVLFFGPGYGNSRVYYSGAAQDLASNGYIVITMDHPIDSDFIEYPDGRNATYEENDSQLLAAFAPFVDRRVSDILFILNDLSTSPRIPGLRSKLKLDKVGALGHSLGGCTAAALMLNSSRFIAGINLDGSMTGPVTTLGLSSPFLMLASAGHTRDGDSSWGTFYDSLRGWRRVIRVNETQHHHYSDTLYLANVLRKDDSVNTPYLSGERMFVIESELVVGFFDKWFKGGNGKALDGPTEGLPELIFDA
ncbi:platelet-activating factor acetylhydrolase-like protein plasma/intracellular [Halenospora varia]|nr:platelet-activating factor acetylhydrolase-like protein plasma/intracellular [Halenospora varia]